ncbi:threonylcarbamoyl-AMP synthase [Flavobacteriales bacterium 34_180_T64]|nr:threonylcarbamoyl-AMP synthase [Flavobacteriales bacterium 34_180_T64]
MKKFNTELKNTIDTLKSGGIILYPTDTVWGIGCDATNIDAVKKIYQLKQREETKSMICLVVDDRMLKKHVEIVPQVALDIIDLTENPTTIIYENPKGLAENLISNDNTIAIRIPDDEFCFQLLRKFNSPIVSTSANIGGQPTPNSFKEIPQEILKGVDYIVNLHQDKKTQKPSSIIKLNTDGLVKIIRE